MVSRGISLLVTALLVFFGVEAGAQTNLIQNGDYEVGFQPVVTTQGGSSELPICWTLLETYVGAGETSQVSPVSDNGPSGTGSYSMRFLRQNGGVSGDWTAMEYQMDIDVTNCSAMDLSLDVKVISHNLPGGGSFDNEWPLVVYVYYDDTAGDSQVWKWGFYITPPGTTGIGAAHETEVPQGVWTSHTFDLMALLADAAVIRTIRVGGAGWDFESQADNVELLCEGTFENTDFVRNGDYEGGFMPVVTRNEGTLELPHCWVNHETFVGPGETSDITQVDDNGPSLPGDSAVNFLRANGGVSGDWTSIQQFMEVDVTQATNVMLYLDVMVISHDLPGGGSFDNEWPVQVLVSYRDAGGDGHLWKWGFYVTPPGTTGIGADHETEVPQGEWTSHSYNLLALVPDLAVITRIRVGGAGWSFEGRADNVQLIYNPVDFIRGDVNDDGLFNIADPVYLLDNLFVNGPNPNCEESADANDDGLKNIADAVYMLTALFVSGPPPPAPHPDCGLDPNPPGLGCAFFNSCP